MMIRNILSPFSISPIDAAVGAAGKLKLKAEAGELILSFGEGNDPSLKLGLLPEPNENPPPPEGNLEAGVEEEGANANPPPPAAAGAVVDGPKLNGFGEEEVEAGASFFF